MAAPGMIPKKALKGPTAVAAGFPKEIHAQIPLHSRSLNFGFE
jgi:hypothetical protein